MENFEKTPERHEIKQPETAVSKFWESLEKKAEESHKPTAEEQIKGWWDGLSKSCDNKSFVDDNDSGDEQSVQPEQPEQTETLEALIKDYYDDLKANSEYPETIDDSNTDWEKQPPEIVAEKRKEFNDEKSDGYKGKLIKEWEENNGKEWPCYEEDVYSKSGKLIRHEGDRYDAHHIKPLSQDGKNEASNITPMHASKHFDKQGVHSPESPYGKIEQRSYGGQL